MGTIPNSSLPFNDNAVNGDNVDYNAWNQAMQVIQLAINDNQSQINAIKNAQTTILVAHGVAYPTNPAPSNGQLFYRDDLSQLKMFNGTLWEDVESVVATANGLSINGVAYNISTSAIANTIALRDATGSITAQTFHGNADTATNSTNANNLTVSGSNLAGSTSATASTIAVRDASGNLTAGTFNGALNGNATTATSATSATTANKLGGNLEIEVAKMVYQSNVSFPSATWGWFGSNVEIAKVNANALYYLEIVVSAGTPSTSSVQLWDTTSNSLVSGSLLSTTNTTPTLLRSSALTLTAGHTYQIQATSNTSNASNNLDARIVAQI